MGGPISPPDDGGPDGVNVRDHDSEKSLLVRQALQAIRPEFEPVTYEAACRQLIGGEPARQVAAEMGKTLNAVYIAKSRVLRRVRDILEELGELGGVADPVGGPPGDEP